ncbi:MAG TPA: efflux transporter outer membrane subunit [Opitutaceae bacterium]|nr:efflux transporter outer membrane subunit [Opitutaceae bacterium]
MRIPKGTGPALAALLLAGCAIGPSYRRPDASAPEAFRGQAGGGPAADLSWTDITRDPQLQGMISEALANGYDTRIAAARVEESRAIASEVHGQLFPGVGYVANADRGRNALLGNANPNGTGTTGDGFDGYLAAAWEFDLWGRVRRLDEAARSEYLASEEAKRGVELSLASDVATSYYGLLELDEELSIARRATQSFGESLRLFNRRLEGGVASRLDTASAEAAMAASAAQVPDIEMRIAAAENQICVLLGRSPGPVARGAALSEQPAPAEVPAGLPSALLERRPDVRQAEEVARAANAGIGVVVGGFLPRIGLSALLGAVSPSLDAITSRRAGLWSVGAGATGPLFQGGGLRGQYDEAKAAWEEAKLRYQQAALNAFADVSSALVSRGRLSEKRAQEERAVGAYLEAVKLSTQRYSLGRASYFEVLQAQQLLFPAEVALAQTRRDELDSVVQLYRALGGGWDKGGR